MTGFGMVPNSNHSHESTGEPRSKLRPETGRIDNTKSRVVRPFASLQTAKPGPQGPCIRSIWSARPAKGVGSGAFGVPLGRGGVSVWASTLRFFGSACKLGSGWLVFPGPLVDYWII